MDYKIFFTVAITFALHQSAHSLKCYSCSSLEPNTTCATPLDTSKTQSIECNQTSARSLSSLFDFPVDIDPELLRATESGTEYQCTVYQKHYKNSNKTETIRNCISKSGDFCRFLNDNSQNEMNKYNLTRCDVCSTDNCNSGTNLHVSAFVFMVLILGSTFK